MASTQNLAKCFQRGRTVLSHKFTFNSLHQNSCFVEIGQPQDFLYLASLLPGYQTIAKQDRCHLLWATTQCFTKLSILSLEYVQSQVMHRLG